MKALLPAWRTTSTAALHRESGIPPAAQILQRKSALAGVRIRSLDRDHPLQPKVRVDTPLFEEWRRRGVRLPRRAWKQKFCSRLWRLLAQTPRLEPPPLPRPQPPSMDPTGGMPKAEGAQAFRDWLKRAEDTDDIIVYSDGSQTKSSPAVPGQTGYGFTVHRGGKEITVGAGRITHGEVYDGEIIGALEGLKEALKLPAGRIHVCLDNTSAARAIMGDSGSSSQHEAMTFVALAREHGDTHVRWVPGHADIPGNDRADELAKAGATLPDPTMDITTLAYLRRKAKADAASRFEAWWQAEMPDSYRALKLTTTTKCPKELVGVPRERLHHLLAARSRHGDFAQYHERFNYQDALLNCSCGRRKAPDHIFSCRKTDPVRRVKLIPSAGQAINSAIGPKYETFLKLVEETNFFEKICPRRQA
ncbi:hypothetical protein HIM_11899 [Hirsutella minnesotensis 3608]|uniref:RNase H type-1 domain-containing protein n=1 Tax=Hirsutella minnesotensis 3608 TaxID=1043627 RepID=A0A0F7ZQZ2_9HYPO|nr:hypothetical protein HIM_11899 [Hirsutella minnesotensis 3608]